MIYKFLIFISFVGFYLFPGANGIFAQCGADGTQPCPQKPSKNSTDATRQRREIAARVTAERERLARQKLARERLRQVSRLKPTETPDWLKNVQKYGEALKRAQVLGLFPVEGVTLGETGGKYLSLIGNECFADDAENKSKNCYEVNGIAFYCDAKNVSDSLHLTSLRLEGMPDEWSKIGFDWSLSYNEWIKLFKRYGYYSAATETPKIIKSGNEKFFKAELLSIVKTANGNVVVTLSFDHGYGKTSADDQGTLFSIDINKLN